MSALRNATKVCATFRVPENYHFGHVITLLIDAQNFGNKKSLHMAGLDLLAVKVL
jgi:hypothetical protein